MAAHHPTTGVESELNQKTLQQLNSCLEAQSKTLTGHIDSKLDSLLESFSQLRAEVSTIKLTSDKASTDAGKSLDYCSVLRTEVNKLKDENLNLKTELLQYKKRLLNLEDEARQTNLLFSGIDEKPGETPALLENKLRKVFDKMQISNKSITIAKAYRLGPLFSSRPRTIKVHFANTYEKEQVWHNRKNLKGSSIFVNEDFSPETSKYRASLTPILKAAKQSNKKCTVIGDTLILEGKKYLKGKLNELPSSLSPLSLSCKTDDASIAFFGRASPLSNFHPTGFNVNGVNYNCCEQYYQSHKAMIANDLTTHDRIMESEDPSEQKRLGSTVKINQDIWDKKSAEVMHCGLLAKFDQNRDIAEYLLNTGNKAIFEASHRDKIWGIGLSLNHPNVLDESVHAGQNLLGKMLMSVREQFKSHLDSNSLKPPNFTTSPTTTNN
jgi:hypothetical protein